MSVRLQVCTARSEIKIAIEVCSFNDNKEVHDTSAVNAEIKVSPKIVEIRIK
jgi:hypothetical protein